MHTRAQFTGNFHLLSSFRAPGSPKPHELPDGSKLTVIDSAKKDIAVIGEQSVGAVVLDSPTVNVGALADLEKEFNRVCGIRCQFHQARRRRTHMSASARTHTASIQRACSRNALALLHRSCSSTRGS